MDSETATKVPKPKKSPKKSPSKKSPKKPPRRTREKIVYEYDMEAERIESKHPQPPPEKILRWYKKTIKESILPSEPHILEYSIIHVSGNKFHVTFSSHRELVGRDAHADAELLADPDQDGRYPVADGVIVGHILKSTLRMNGKRVQDK